ncbi:hypothetical protein WICPIJ_001701 [Wickerhamomyces pijperi]|uniref:Uncharacterized protein n=1 Tax=Wickerhamomyces pijperi TaxID=599730 RepID=A0A9P8TPM6_WICPI|nr:hypothetical protein WICPIJ_001701 [Wickerhamomyces pijperi]
MIQHASSVGRNPSLDSVEPFLEGSRITTVSLLSISVASSDSKISSEDPKWKVALLILLTLALCEAKVRFPLDISIPIRLSTLPLNEIPRNPEPQ